MNQTTILVVDDDIYIHKLLQASLIEEGWQIYSAFNGDEAIKSFHANHPDLVILDIMMPGVDGIEVCRHIASVSSTPVIMLSAKSDLDDKVGCLQAGADDYLTKPFQTEELLARVWAALRRHNREKPVQESRLVFNDLDFDMDARRVTVRGSEIRLTTTEYRLLEELILNAGKALTYKYLLNRVWGLEYSDERQYVHEYIKRLRLKIEQDPKNPEYLLNVPGTGYLFKNAG